MFTILAAISLLPAMAGAVLVAWSDERRDTLTVPAAGSVWQVTPREPLDTSRWHMGVGRLRGLRTREGPRWPGRDEALIWIVWKYRQETVWRRFGVYAQTGTAGMPVDAQGNALFDSPLPNGWPGGSCDPVPFWYVAVRLELFFAATMALPLACGAWRLGRVAVRRRRAARSAAGLCAKCGYDLRGNLGRCPECGTDRPPHAPPASPLPASPPPRFAAE